MLPTRMAADEEGIFKCTSKDAASDVYESAALDRCSWQQNPSLVTGQYSDLKVCYFGLACAAGHIRVSRAEP